MIERIPELPYNGLVTSNGMFPWYNPADDTTYRANAGDIIAGLVDPNDAWNPVYVYSVGDISTVSGQVWISDANGNEGNPPGPMSAFWHLDTGGVGVPVPAWPLAGSADLIASVGIKGDGAGSFAINLGYNETQSAGFELQSFNVAARNPGDAPGMGNIFVSNGGMIGRFDDEAGGSSTIAANNNLTSFVGAFDNAIISGANLVVGSKLITYDRSSNVAFGSIVNGAVNDYVIYQYRGLAAEDGFGMRVSYDIPNSIDVQKSLFLEWSWENSADGSEDHKYEILGYSGGAQSEFFTVHGGIDKQFEVYGPVKLDTLVAQAAADHEGALLYDAGSLKLSDGASWNTIGGTSINKRNERITTGSVPASSLSDVTLIWSTPFADTNYTPVASVIESTGTLAVNTIKSKTASQIVVTVLNSGAGALTGEIQAIAIHD